MLSNWCCLKVLNHKYKYSKKNLCTEITYEIIPSSIHEDGEIRAFTTDTACAQPMT